MNSGERRQTEAGPVAMDPSKEPGTEPVPLSVTLLRGIESRVRCGLETSDLTIVYNLLDQISHLCIQGKIHIARIQWERSMLDRPRPEPPKARTADDLLSDL